MNNGPSAGRRCPTLSSRRYCSLVLPTRNLELTTRLLYRASQLVLRLVAQNKLPLSFFESPAATELLAYQRH